MAVAPIQQPYSEGFEVSDIVIIGFSNPNSEGVILTTNKPAQLKGGRMPSKETWVSWDKIGAALFEGYTTEDTVAGLDKLRGLIK